MKENVPYCRRGFFVGRGNVGGGVEGGSVERLGVSPARFEDEHWKKDRVSVQVLICIAQMIM